MNATKSPKKADNSNVIEVEVKGVTVKIYPRPKPNGNGFNYQVVDYSSGQRKFISCPTEEKAKKESKRIASLISAGDARALAMTGEDRQQLVAIRAKLAPLKIDPVVAASEYAAAFEKLNGRSLIQAVEDYVHRNPTARDSCPLSDAIAQLIEARKKDKRSGDHLRDLKVRLEVFSEAYQNYNVADVSAEEVNAFLRGLSCGGRSRNNTAAQSLRFSASAPSKKSISRKTTSRSRGQKSRAPPRKNPPSRFLPQPK